MTSSLHFFEEESSGASTAKGPKVVNGREGEKAHRERARDATHPVSGMKKDDVTMEIAHDESIGSPLRCKSSLADEMPRTGMWGALRGPMHPGMHLWTNCMRRLNAAKDKTIRSNDRSVLSGQETDSQPANLPGVPKRFKSFVPLPIERKSETLDVVARSDASIVPQAFPCKQLSTFSANGRAVAHEGKAQESNGKLHGKSSHDLNKDKSTGDQTTIDRAEDVLDDLAELETEDAHKKSRRRHPSHRKKEMAESDVLLQPLAQKLDEYYLLDEGTLIEEDQLPAHQVGKFSMSVAKQVALPDAMALMFHPIPPRIVGGVQDRVHIKKISCSCKGSKRSSGGSGSVCLKMYCDCFATGDYCSEKCKCHASCYNNAAESSVQPRTDAIVEVLKKDQSAFRHAHAKIAQLQKDRRIRLLKTEVKTAKPSLQNQSGNRPSMATTLPKPVDTTSATYSPPVSVLTTQLQPSYYAVPLKVDNGSTALTGLSFSLTHPRNRKTKTKGPQNTSLDLKEGPRSTSNSGSAIHKRSEREITETPVETFWKKETARTSAFFQAMRAREDPAQKPWSWHPFEETQKDAAARFITIKEDIEGVKTVVTAARIDIMARFYQENRLKRGYAVETNEMDSQLPDRSKRNRSNNPDDEAMILLQCDEALEPTESTFPSVDDVQLKEMTILVAQDAALLQETSRIVRRMTRELCQRRSHVSA
jgi:hypothetical protein